MWCRAALFLGLSPRERSDGVSSPCGRSQDIVTGKARLLPWRYSFARAGTASETYGRRFRRSCAPMFRFGLKLAVTMAERPWPH